MTDTWLIVGLGNPGSEYAHNRHNVGQMVLDELAHRVGGGFKSHKSRAQVLEGRLGIGGPRVVLAKPMSYMNVSGGPVSALAKFFDIEPDHVIAVHDEIDIPLILSNSRSAAARAATTAFVTFPRRWPRRTTCACGWAWVGRRAGWTPLTSCCGTSPRRRRRNCPS